MSGGPSDTPILTQRELTSSLEQFSILVKSASGPRSLSTLIKQCIDHEHTFVFAELLQVDSIKSLRGTEFENSLHLLELFAFGTYTDYKKNKQTFPQLSQKNITKLKKLTLVTLAQGRRTLPYSFLQSELDIENVRELEDILIDSCYTGILIGKLDQKNQCFEVHELIGRDVRNENELDEILNVMIDWDDHCKNILTKLHEYSTYAQQTFGQAAADKMEHNKKIESKLKELRKTGKSSAHSTGPMLHGHDEDDDVIMQDPRSQRRRA